jgi:predicted patatin/cPLA2 family phospholipase
MRNYCSDRITLACAFSPVLIALLCLNGCMALPRKEAVPANKTMHAEIPEAPGARYWPDLDPSPLFRDNLISIDRETNFLASQGSYPEHLPPAYLLAISGGGDAGAFGAGLLAGWSKEGSRPRFKLVTGISAGALIAPFAFLGPKYDETLRSVCSSIGPSNIFNPRNVVAALIGDGFADNAPLAQLIEKYVTHDLLAEIAQEYARGRMLLIGTTDLDSRQRVVWNMGAIASSPDPRALTLFRKVMLASTAIPGIFPPVMIDVEVDGKRYQEMHVDGGVMNQVFLLPPFFIRGFEQTRSVENRERHVYIIRNGRLDARWQPVDRRTTAVAHRALDALIDAQGLNDLYRLQVAAEKAGEDFHVAYIGDEFTYPHAREFDSDYLRHLFDYSYAQAATAGEWKPQIPAVTLSAWELEQARSRAKQVTTAAVQIRDVGESIATHGNP